VSLSAGSAIPAARGGVSLCRRVEGNTTIGAEIHGLLGYRGLEGTDIDQQVIAVADYRSIHPAIITQSVRQSTTPLCATAERRYA
jgi:hypothetical protein